MERTTGWGGPCLSPKFPSPALACLRTPQGWGLEGGGWGAGRGDKIELQQGYINSQHSTAKGSRPRFAVSTPGCSLRALTKILSQVKTINNIQSGRRGGKMGTPGPCQTLCKWMFLFKWHGVSNVLKGHVILRSATPLLEFILRICSDKHTKMYIQGHSSQSCL